MVVSSQVGVAAAAAAEEDMLQLALSIFGELIEAGAPVVQEQLPQILQVSHLPRPRPSLLSPPLLHLGGENGLDRVIMLCTSLQPNHWRAEGLALYWRVGGLR